MDDTTPPDPPWISTALGLFWISAGALIAAIWLDDTAAAVIIAGMAAIVAAAWLSRHLWRSKP